MEPENALIAPTRSAAGIKLLLASLFGIAIFFIPFELAGRSTIMVDHLAGFLIAQRPLAVGLILLLIGYGAITPLLDGRWRARPIDRLLSLFKLIGLVLALMYVANLGPAWLMTPDRLPFLFDKLAMSVGLIVPIGAMALTFLLGFGLLELIGVLMQPVMRPLWRTPGHSAIDAVASHLAAGTGRTAGNCQGTFCRAGRDVLARHFAQRCRPAGALCHRSGIGQLGSLLLRFHTLHPGHPDPGECGPAGGDLAAAHPAWHSAGRTVRQACHGSRLAELNEVARP
nr:hypothetical protein [Aeromonas salmonicida]